MLGGQLGRVKHPSLLTSLTTSLIHRKYTWMYVVLTRISFNHTLAEVTHSETSVLALSIARELRINGPMSSPTLRARLRARPATFGRAIASLRGELLTEGATSSLIYALRRSIPGLPAEIPMYELGVSRVRVFGTLRPVEPRGFHVVSTFPVRGFYPDLPWFLHDLRAAGFLGRLAPRQHPELGLSPDILRWSADDALRWLHEWGVDTVGNFIVGDPALQRIHQHGPPEVPVESRFERYPGLAEQAMSVGVPGSSAAGEQPKFLATRVGAAGPAPVLVKFSPRVVDGTTRRTADLLRCEHHALGLLRRNRVSAAGSAILTAGGRTFLEVERFDRAGDGRLGIVSLLAFGASEGASLHDWSTAAEDLASRGAIGPEDRQRIHLLDRFGLLIGNTDRHAGNLSFFFADGRVSALAPVYDMLPMAYAVRAGEFATPLLTPPVPPPRFVSIWRCVWALATEFWGLVAEDGDIHEDMRQAADANRVALVGHAPLLDRLPADPAHQRA